MHLNDVQKKMMPLLEIAAKEMVPHRKLGKLAQLAYLDVVLQKAGGSQAVAALRLGVTPGRLCQLVSQREEMLLREREEEDKKK